MRVGNGPYGSEENFPKRIHSSLIVFSWADVSTWTRNIFLFHMIGSFMQINFFTYSCHGLLDESVNVCTATYSGCWTTLPMNKVGILLRGHLIFIMMRSQRPCCLTAGGFFPVSLETSTAIMSSTMSYFALMKQSSADISEN
ncbi:odorant receptor 10-like [Xylocopa sonorina]|uniref:odorant receptor 10-like n=1 Tax=Xylocopa sonorina TaxID=1818115 RepID=UPI00403B1922